MGDYRNDKSLQSVLRSSEEVVVHVISHHVIAKLTVPTQFLTAAHTTQPFLLMVGNGTFSPSLYGWI